METISTDTYSTIVTGQDQALSHLFFHCCLEDERFTEDEMNRLSAMLVELGLQPKLHVKDELISYRHYKPGIGDETSYLKYLIHLIQPVNELALYSYCGELCFSDTNLDARVDALLNKLAEILGIGSGDQVIINKLLAQRRAVELQKIF